MMHAETPKGVWLELRPAGVTARLYAFLIDLAVRAAILIIASMALAWAGGMAMGVLF